MTIAIAVQPKKVRGLSLLQKRIMAVAAKGWITPAEARDCGWTDANFDSDTADESVAAAVSRALRRLVKRGLLIYCRPKYKAQSSAYRLPDWHGELPYNNSAHTRFEMMMSMNIAMEPSESQQGVLKALRDFDATLADRYKRLDISLTKAEREYAKDLPDAEQREKDAKFLEEHPTLGERLRACLTESQPALPKDVSVEEGRSVLVDILNRPQLGNQKSLVAANDGDPVLG